MPTHPRRGECGRSDGENVASADGENVASADGENVASADGENVASALWRASACVAAGKRFG